jgi:cell division control protein 6
VSSLETSESGRRALGTHSRNGVGEKGLVCYVDEKEVEGQISGAGEGILRSLLHAEAL